MDLFFTTIDLNNIAVMTKEFIKNAVSPSLTVFGIIGKYVGDNWWAQVQVNQAKY